MSVQKLLIGGGFQLQECFYGGRATIHSLVRTGWHSGGTSVAVAQLSAGGLPPRTLFLEDGGLPPRILFLEEGGRGRASLLLTFTPPPSEYLTLVF
jgi:hypothetical protein